MTAADPLPAAPSEERYGPATDHFEELTLLGPEFNPPPVSLADRFLIPPFSVLDTRQGLWQERKRRWLDTGIRSEVGRGDNLIGYSKTASLAVGNTSIFDPVLCELVYRWFTGHGARILDPFAGGSVRGVVAAFLGRHYTGVELRPEQVASNEEQWAELTAKWPGLETHKPTWICGDAADLLDLSGPADEYDLILTCPPYADLERYSDDPRDLSTMPYEEFRQALTRIVAGAASLLRPNRFACIVVAEVRGKDGAYYGLVPDTVFAFVDAGLDFYNEAALVNAVGSGAIRAPRIFPPKRKLTKLHQNVLVFCKGDPELAARAAGELDMGF